MEEDSSSPECAICLQPLLYPVKLPCNHQFCYLCVKGIRDNVTKRCAMCRTDFSLTQIEQSLELKQEEVVLSKFKWFYEAKSGGWWAFDERCSGEIESAYGMSKDGIAINIAGYTYIIDFAKMQQFRKDTPTRIRKIKRQESKDNKGDFKIKGIAGLRVASTSTESPQIDLTKDEDQLSKSLSNIVVIDDDETS